MWWDRVLNPGPLTFATRPGNNVFTVIQFCKHTEIIRNSTRFAKYKTTYVKDSVCPSKQKQELRIFASDELK